MVFSVISQFCHGFPPPLHQATPDPTSRSTASSKFHPPVILVAWRKRRMGKGDLRRGLGTPLLQRAVPHLLTRVMMLLGPLMFQTTSQLTTSQWKFEWIFSSYVMLWPKEGYDESGTLSNMCSKTGGEKIWCYFPQPEYFLVWCERPIGWVLWGIFWISDLLTGQ